MKTTMKSILVGLCTLLCTATAWADQSWWSLQNGSNPGNYTASGKTMRENYYEDAYYLGDQIRTTITGLANGYYRVKVYATASWTPERGNIRTAVATDGELNRSFVYANTVRQTIPVVHQTGFSTLSEYTLYAEVSDGTLTVGITNDQRGSNWQCLLVDSYDKVLPSEIPSSKVPLIAALERFEEDYNDGVNGALRKMSREAWHTLVTGAGAAATAKDDADLSTLGTAAATFNAAMDAAEPSISLYNKYALLYQGLNRLDAAHFPAGTYDTDAIHATDVTVSQAILDMDEAFARYKELHYDNLDVTVLAGENMDFEAAQGTQLNGKAYTQPGWTMTYVYAGANENKQYETFTTETDDLPEGAAEGSHALHMRNRWAGGAGKAQITKTFALPAGKYSVSAWMKVATSTAGHLCYYEVDGVPTDFLPATFNSWEKVSKDIELDAPAVITLSFGVSGGNNMDVYVDDITLTLKLPTQYERAHAAAEQLSVGGDVSPAIASALEDYKKATQPEAEAALYDIEQATAVLRNAVAIANDDNRVTGLLANADFKGGMSEANSSGGGMYPAGWTFTRNLEDWNDCKVTPDGVFNMWAGTIHEAILQQTIYNLPNGIYEISADFKNDIHDGKSGIGLFADQLGTDTGRSIDVGTGEKNNDDFYTSQVYVEVKAHKMNVGVYSNRGYYQVKDIQVKMVPATDANKALVGNSRIYQALAFDRSRLEYDFTGEALADAQAADVKPMLTQPNALFTAASTGQLNFTDNVIVNGTCESLVITDKAPFHTTEGFTATSATYTRENTNTWGTVMLPYPVQSDTDVQYYTLKNVTTGTDGVMTFAPVGSLPANTPGVFVKQDGEGVVLSGRDVRVAAGGAGSHATDVTGWTLHGTYETLTLDTEQAGAELYYIAADKFWHATGGIEVLPFRAYFTAPKSANNVRAFRLVAEEGTDDIHLVPATDAAPIHTLSGVRVPDNTKLKPGLYIIGGKKVAVK